VGWPRIVRVERATGALIALFPLIALVVAMPWMFGGVTSGVTTAATGAALLISLAVVLRGAWAGRTLPFYPPFAAAGAFVVLAMLQLVPLPRGLHATLAPESARAWYPAEAAAAAILGPGPRPISVNPPATRRGLAFAAGALALSLLAAPALSGHRTALASSLVVGGAASLLALYSLLGRLAFGNRLYGVFDVPTVAPFGPFVSKNHFAGYVEMACLLVLGVALGWMRRGDGRSPRLAWIGGPRAGRIVWGGGLAAIMSLGVLASQSRGGAVSLAFGALVLVAAGTSGHWRGTKRAVLVRAGAVALVGAAFFLALPSAGRARIVGLVGAADEQAGAFRLRTWRDSLQLSAASPFVGSGLGTFADAFASFKSGSGAVRVENAENDYLQVLAEMGALGLVGVVGGVAWLGQFLLTGIRRQQDVTLRGLGVGALAGLAALAVHSLFDFNLRIPSNALLAAFLVGLGCGAGGRSRAGGAVVLAATAAILVAALVCLASEWGFSPPRTNPRPPGSSSLRMALEEQALRHRVDRRPKDAASWVTLGWVRYVQGAPGEGAALARYGASLDPLRKELEAAAHEIAAGGPAGASRRGPVPQ
jgi:O-antigen ligase